MNVARPAGGFRIVIKPEVSAYIAEENKVNFRVDQCWTDLLERLKITALREGTRLQAINALRFTFIADGAPDFQIPTIQVVYECSGEELVITGALVWNEADHDADEEDDTDQH